MGLETNLETKTKSRDSITACYNHRSNRNFPMFLLKKRPHKLLLLPKSKSYSGSGSGFSLIIDSGTPAPGPKEKRRIPPESTPALRIWCHLWTIGPDFGSETSFTSSAAEVAGVTFSDSDSAPVPKF